MTLTIPELSLIVLIGPPGSGISSFARKHFKPTEVHSGDYFPRLVPEDNEIGSPTQMGLSLHS